MKNHKPLFQSLYVGNSHHIFIPFCLQHPIKLIMFLCNPIFFITSNSETRPADSISVASSAAGKRVHHFSTEKMSWMIQNDNTSQRKAPTLKKLDRGY